MSKSEWKKTLTKVAVAKLIKLMVPPAAVQVSRHISLNGYKQESANKEIYVNMEYNCRDQWQKLSKQTKIRMFYLEHILQRLILL